MGDGRTILDRSRAVETRVERGLLQASSTDYLNFQVGVTQHVQAAKGVDRPPQRVVQRRDAGDRRQQFAVDVKKTGLVAADGVSQALNQSRVGVVQVSARVAVGDNLSLVERQRLDHLSPGLQLVQAAIERRVVVSAVVEIRHHRLLEPRFQKRNETVLFGVRQIGKLHRFLARCQDRLQLIGDFSFQGGRGLLGKVGRWYITRAIDKR